MVNRSPRCSTASRRSAKLRAASVELTSDTKSDYQIPGGDGVESPKRSAAGDTSGKPPGFGTSRGAITSAPGSQPMTT
jgi:hypothetical protein